MSRISSSDNQVASRPTPLIRSKPLAPSPEATSDEVQEFFQAYFLAIYDHMTEEQAKERASAFLINGYGLYLQPASSFEKVFGADGPGIAEILNVSYLTIFCLMKYIDNN